MQIELDSIIHKCLGELKDLGMKESTIQSYKNSAYRPIQNHCVRQGVTRYEPTMLDAYLSSQKKRLKSNKISCRHYRRIRRAVLMLHDLSVRGSLQSGRYTAGSKYKTNEYFRRCLIRFLEEQDLSKGTLAGLKSNILQFLHYLDHNGHSDFHTLSPTEVKNYLMVAAETHQRSMGNVLYALHFFLGYLRENEMIHQDFTSVLNKPAHRKKRILPSFTYEEVESILNQINTETNEGKRDYAILFLASHTGLRSVDIANLRLTDLDWMNNTLQIIQRKTSRPLLLPLETTTGNAIANYILNARPKSKSEYVFLTMYAPYRKLSDVRSIGNILEKYRKKAGIIHKPGDGKSLHALRRSMGTWMLESGTPLDTLSQVLGHKNLDSTKPYLSMDHQNLAECALDFQGIPVERGPFQ